VSSLLGQIQALMNVEHDVQSKFAPQAVNYRILPLFYEDIFPRLTQLAPVLLVLL
jgi:hypothetical protein